MRTTFIRTAAVPAALLALLAAGCSQPATAPSSPASAPSSASTEPVTLTVATFNEFGYNDLLAEYTALNPNVKAVEKKAATSDEARENFMTKLAAGSGLSDIEGVEVDWLPEIMQSSDLLADLNGIRIAHRGNSDAAHRVIRDLGERNGDDGKIVIGIGTFDICLADLIVYKTNRKSIGIFYYMVIRGDQKFTVVLSDNNTGTLAFYFLFLCTAASRKHTEIILYFLYRFIGNCNNRRHRIFGDRRNIQTTLSGSTASCAA